MITVGLPELFEDDEQPAVEIRTELLPTLRELGPPDLVHLVKQSTKSSSKQFGVYHHVTGIDASSSASLAAYVNTLIYSPTDKTHKVVSGLYCCYNAFSRLDMRVQVTIPGSVESYCIDERGDKRVASDNHWLEAFLCAVLRAYHYADDGGGDSIRKIIGCRRFNPITTTETEHKFFEAAERLFFNGWQLGCNPEAQVPSLVSNLLTDGLLSYITTTGRYASGINLFEKLRTRNTEISALLAQVLIAADEEVKAVRLLHDTVEELPMDHALLITQADFCGMKGRHDMALELAKRAVIAAPSEFRTWAKLAEVYIALKQWDFALLTLNSCPMFTYQDKDAPRMPQPERAHLPLLPEVMCDEIDESQPIGDGDLIHPSLRKLVAGGFRGTFQKAYSLLTRITKEVGWDNLLKVRSQVFVMEEEYRNERQVVDKTRNASTLALNGDAEEARTEGVPSSADSEATSEATAALNGEDSTLEKPTHIATADTKLVPNDGSFPDPAHEKYSTFRHKRLCERWLDNLFMVLYEDLRIFTIWQTEAAQYRQQQIAYRKSAEEWEVLGDLAERLHYPKEELDAYQHCLSVRFSAKAMRGVLQAWLRDHDTRNIVGALVRLICWQYRWYSEFSPFLFQTVRKLIEEEGAVKVRNMAQASRAASLPQHVIDLTNQYVQVCASFRSTGTDG